MPFDLSGSKASFFFVKAEAGVVRAKMRATFHPSVTGYTSPMLALGLQYEDVLEGAIQIVPAGGVAWEATDVAWAIVDPLAVGSTPFEVELVWGPSGASVILNGGAPIGLSTLAAPPESGSVQLTVSAGGGGGSGGPLGVVDWVDLTLAKAPPFWTAFRDTYEVQ